MNKTWPFVTFATVATDTDQKLNLFFLKVKPPALLILQGIPSKGRRTKKVVPGFSQAFYRHTHPLMGTKNTPFPPCLPLLNLVVHC